MKRKQCAPPWQAEKDAKNDIKLDEIENLILREVESKPRILKLHKSFERDFHSGKHTPFRLIFLSWSGVRCYDDEQPSHINFEELKNMNSLLGKNDSGKSSILEFICITLFNRLSDPTMSKKHMLHKHNDIQEGWIRCILKTQDNDVYTVERCWSGKENLTKVRLCKNDVDITRSTLVDTYKYMEDNVTGSYFIFKETVLAFQDRTSIVRLDRNECYELFCHIISLDKLKMIERENHLQLLSCKKNLAVKNKEPIHYKLLETTESELATKKDDIKKSIVTIEDTKEAIAGLHAEIDTLQPVAFSCAYTVQEVVNNIPKDSNGDNILFSVESQASIEKQLKEITECLRNDEKEFEEWKRMCNEQLDTHTLCKQALAENIKPDINFIRPDINFFNMHRGEYLKVKMLCKQALTEEEERNKKVQQLNEHIEELKLYKNIRDLDVFTREFNEFGVMYQKDYLSEEGSKRQLLAETKASKYIWDVDCTSCMSNRQQIQDTVTKLEEWFKNFERLGKEYELLKVEHTKCYRKFELQRTVGMLNKEIDDGREHVSSARMQFSSLHNQMYQSYQKLHMRRRYLEHILKNTLVCEAHQKWQELLPIAKQASEAKEKLRIAQSQIKKENLKLITAITTNSRLINDVACSEDELTKKKLHTKACQQLIDEIEDREQYESIINSKTGLPMAMMCDIVNRVAMLANSVLDEIESNFTIAMLYTPKGIEIFIDESIPVHQASGYQKFVLDIIMRKVLASLTDNLPSILFIDEGFGTADVDHASTLCCDVMPRLATQFEKIIIISHFAKVHDVTSTQLRITTQKCKKSTLNFGSIPNSAWIQRSMALVGKPQILLKKMDNKKPVDEKFFKAVDADGVKIQCEICMKVFSSKSLTQHKKSQAHINAMTGLS